MAHKAPTVSKLPVKQLGSVGEYDRELRRKYREGREPRRSPAPDSPFARLEALKEAIKASEGLIRPIGDAANVLATITGFRADEGEWRGHCTVYAEDYFRNKVGLSARTASILASHIDERGFIFLCCIEEKVARGAVWRLEGIGRKRVDEIFQRVDYVHQHEKDFGIYS